MGVQQNYKKTPNLPNPLVLWEGNQDEREETGPGPHGKAVAGPAPRWPSAPFQRQFLTWYGLW